MANSMATMQGCCCEECDLVAGMSVEQTGTFPDDEWEFTDESTTGCAGGIVSHHWDFGDGNTSTDANPTHQYAYDDPGPWTVVHTVTDDCECEDDVEMVVHRLLNCTNMRTWMGDNITSFDVAYNGSLSNGTCTDCGDLNGHTVNAPWAIATTWFNTSSIGVCTPTSQSSQTFVAADCTATPNLRVAADIRWPAIGTTDIILWDREFTPPLSTAIFSSPVTLSVCDNGGSAKCGCGTATVDLTANF